MNRGAQEGKGLMTWLTLEQSAERVQVHEATLRREIRSGRLRCARVGGRKLIRIKPEWLDTWLSGRDEQSEG